MFWGKLRTHSHATYYNSNYRGDVVLTDLKSCLELMRQNINNNITVLKGKAGAQVLEWYIYILNINVTCTYT